MPKTKAKTISCDACQGHALTKRIATYPVRLTSGELAGKEIHVDRVALHQCDICGHLMPTPAGQAKVQRCVGRATEFLLGASR